jgi:hypothetical protein
MVFSRVSSPTSFLSRAFSSCKLEVAHLVGVEAGISSSSGGSLLGDADVANQFGHRHSRFRLLQHRDDLLDTKALSLHGKTLPSAQSLPKLTSLVALFKEGRSGARCRRRGMFPRLRLRAGNDVILSRCWIVEVDAAADS